MSFAVCQIRECTIRKSSRSDGPYFEQGYEKYLAALLLDHDQFSNFAIKKNLEDS